MRGLLVQLEHRDLMPELLEVPQAVHHHVFGLHDADRAAGFLVHDAVHDGADDGVDQVDAHALLARRLMPLGGARRRFGGYGQQVGVEVLEEHVSVAQHAPRALDGLVAVLGREGDDLLALRKRDRPDLLRLQHARGSRQRVARDDRGLLVHEVEVDARSLPRQNGRRLLALLALVGKRVRLERRIDDHEDLPRVSACEERHCGSVDDEVGERLVGQKLAGERVHEGDEARDLPALARHCPEHRGLQQPVGTRRAREEELVGLELRSRGGRQAVREAARPDDSAGLGVQADEDRRLGQEHDDFLEPEAVRGHVVLFADADLVPGGADSLGIAAEADGAQHQRERLLDDLLRVHEHANHVLRVGDEAAHEARDEVHLCDVVGVEELVVRGRGHRNVDHRTLLHVPERLLPLPQHLVRLHEHDGVGFGRGQEAEPDAAVLLEVGLDCDGVHLAMGSEGGAVDAGGGHLPAPHRQRRHAEPVLGHERLHQHAVAMLVHIPRHRSLLHVREGVKRLEVEYAGAFRQRNRRRLPPAHKHKGASSPRAPERRRVRGRIAASRSDGSGVDGRGLALEDVEGMHFLLVPVQTHDRLRPHHHARHAELARAVRRRRHQACSLRHCAPVPQLQTHDLHRVLRRVPAGRCADNRHCSVLALHQGLHHNARRVRPPPPNLLPHLPVPHLHLPPCEHQHIVHRVPRHVRHHQRVHVIARPSRQEFLVHLVEPVQGRVPQQHPVR
mmetsp:Transcript_12308/g.29407  ORF Transcript_12308/g.29407 Transcript_12308/m.29407 type:complete len:731 (-) Transcript_12308:407-2599(-)